MKRNVDKYKEKLTDDNYVESVVNGNGYNALPCREDARGKNSSS